MRNRYENRKHKESAGKTRGVWKIDTTFIMRDAILSTKG